MKSILLGTVTFLLLCALFLSPATPITTHSIVDPKREAAELRKFAEQWLFPFTKENGLFEYELNPKTGKYSTKNNELRQLMASRLLAARAARDDAFSAAHQKNLAFIFRYWYQFEDGKGYVYYDHKSKLGGNAMLLRTLVASPHFETYTTEARALVEGIFATTRGNRFRAWYKEPSYEYDEDYLLTFYSGEALLALMEYVEKTGDSAVLARTLPFAAAYKEHYVDQMSASYYPAYVPWMTMAFKKVYAATGDKSYADALFMLNDKLLEMQDTEEYVGRFFNEQTPQYGTPHASSDAVYTEGLVHALLIARAVGDTARAERYDRAITRSLGNLVTLQYRTPQPGFAAASASYLGALKERATGVSVRIDSAQHLIDALDAYLE